jgi:phytoene synthase
MKRKNIPKEWIESFFHSMTLDTYKKNYQTMEELSDYLYGSAEVIGLVMCKILNLPAESYDYAKMLGRAFQYINFIRDIAEDNSLGRCYFPENIRSAHNLKTLEYTEIQNKQTQFSMFMKDAIEQYLTWQSEGEKGFRYIPKRYLVPIKAASDIYRLTARIIVKNPQIVFQKKVKPNKLRILTSIVYNCFAL